MCPAPSVRCKRSVTAGQFQVATGDCALQAPTKRQRHLAFAIRKEANRWKSTREVVSVVHDVLAVSLKSRGLGPRDASLIDLVSASISH